MALHCSHRPWRRVAAVVTVGLLALAGCGAVDTPAGEAAAPAAASPATATATGPAASADEQEPTSTEGDTAGPSQATAEPPAQAEGSAPAAAEEPAQEPVITIADFAYEVPDTVPPGSTITVVNDDSEAHIVTSSDDFNVTVTAGESTTFTAPEEPGEYTIICLFHGNMTATLVVA